MESFVDDGVTNERLRDTKILLQHAGSGSLTENINSVSRGTLNKLGEIESADIPECIASLRTLCALLQLKRSISEKGYDESDPLAVESFKTAVCILMKLSRDYDSTGDLLCRVIYLSLLIMSENDIKTSTDYIISKCESSLSVYLKSEGQQYDGFHPQIAIQLLTVIFDAVQKMLILPKLAITLSYKGVRHLNVSHDIVVRLALCQFDVLRAQTLLLLIPKIVQFEDTNVFLQKLLQAIVSCEGEEDINRGLGTLSALSSFYLPEGKSKTAHYAAEDISFWKLVQCGLCSDTALTRKHALYLVRRFINILSCDGQDINNEFFFWSTVDKDRLYRTWQDICTILEVLEERAIHLVSPALNMLESHFSFCVRNSDDIASVCFLKWILTTFRIVLRHSCTHVVKWGVETLLSKAGNDLVASINARVFQPFISPLMQCLNTSYIYYDTDDESQDNEEFPEIFEKLEKFLVSAAQGEHRQMFFYELFSVMGTINWAPIPAFIISKALSRVPPFTCLNKEDISIVRRLVGKFTATQNITIRIISLHHLLITVMNLFDLDDCSMNNILQVFSAFNQEKADLSCVYNCHYFPRGSEVWTRSVKWLENFSQTWDTSVVRINDCVLDTDHSSSVSAQLIILLLDGDLENFNSLVSLFSYLIDSASRLYADQEVLSRLVEILAHMVGASRVLQPCHNFDTTRKTVLHMVKTTLCSILELMEKRLFCIPDSYATFHINTRLLRCLNLFIEDPDTAEIILKEKLFMNVISSAFMTVEGGCKENVVKYCFAVNVLKSASKYVPDIHVRSQINEKIFESAKKILLSKELSSSFTANSCGEFTWMEEVQGFISSEICEAQWTLITVYVGHSCDETTAVKIVKAVGVALDVGGRDLLPTLCNVLAVILSKYPPEGKPPVPELRSCWANILQVRHKDIFYPALRKFLQAIFQPEVIFRADWAMDFALECAKELLDLGDSATGVVNELSSVLQSLVHQQAEKTFLSPIRRFIIACFMFGPIQRRDQKLLRKITSLIKSENGLAAGNDHQLGNQCHVLLARSAAAEMILFVMDVCDSEGRKTQIADMLAFDLMKETESPDARKSRYFANSLTHRIQLRVLQGLMLVEAANSMEAKKIIGKWLLKRLREENHQLSVRYMTEWLLVRILRCVNTFQEELLNILEKAGDFRESAVCSVVCTLLHTSQSLETLLESEQEKTKVMEVLGNFLNRFFVVLVPMTMAQAYSVRFNSHVAILRVWESMRKLNLKSEMQQYEIVAAAVQKSFDQASNRFQSHNDFYLSDFHSQEHHSLETVFYELPRLTVMSSDEWIKPELFRKVGISETASIPLLNKNRRLEQCSPPLNQRRGDSTADMPSQPGCLQKKMVPSKWLEINELQIRCLPESLRPGNKERRSDSPRKSRGLVVVASLLDKASNLGGLSRTCEIMGASLVLPKLSYTRDREFQALSMSSEMWASMEEVKPFELPTFLTEMKKLGFTIVGAEQTASSVSLSNVQFDENTVLLLGNEREGVPANLLPLLDICVEIPQYGVVRSLNVHVAGALFMYEYTRQHAQRLLQSGS